LVRIALECLSVQCFSRRRVAFRLRGLALLRESIRLARQDSPNELSQGWFRQCADKLVDDLSSGNRFDRRDATNSELGREVRVLVYVDLGDEERTAMFLGQPIEQRPQSTTRTTPRGPEVDDHRDAARRIHDFRVEVVLTDVFHPLTHERKVVIVERARNPRPRHPTANPEAETPRFDPYIGGPSPL
jgi:hypothetical protein